jgi:hypothetical protein
VTGSSRRAIANHTAHLVQRDSRFQLAHPPGGASLGVRGDVAARAKLDGDVKAAVLSPRRSRTAATACANSSTPSRLTGKKPS